MHANLTDTSVHVPGPAAIEIPSHEEIAVAFGLFEQRHGAGGSDWTTG